MLKPGLVKGPWTEEVSSGGGWESPSRSDPAFPTFPSRCRLVQEDATVRALVAEYGTKKWSQIASQLPGRLGKQCRERCGRGERACRCQ